MDFRCFLWAVGGGPDPPGGATPLESGAFSARMDVIRVDMQEEELGADDMIIMVRRGLKTVAEVLRRPWRVAEGRLHAPTELVVSKNQSLLHLQEKLRERFKGLLTVVASELLLPMFMFISFCCVVLSYTVSQYYYYYRCSYFYYDYLLLLLVLRKSPSLLLLRMPEDPANKENEPKEARDQDLEGCRRLWFDVSRTF